MFQTIIIDHHGLQVNNLADQIKHYCPNLNLIGIAENKEECLTFLQDSTIEIVFFNPLIIHQDDQNWIKPFTVQKPFICISDSSNHLSISAFWQSVAYLSQPIQIENLVLAVKSAQDFIEFQKEFHKREKLIQLLLNNKKEERLIGIPTIEGFEIILVDDIIRCEGLHKCTRIITKDKTDIISSYNVGVFKKLLKGFSEFFIPHRSHIVNLLFIKKFKKSGVIIFKDGSYVPIAKNRKEDFLEHINQI